MNGWIGVDLDGTLAMYKRGEYDHAKVGEPIPLMVNRVKEWLKAGLDVRIFTARVWSDGSSPRNLEVSHARIAINEWCLEQFGQTLPITCQKDYGMIALWDDRAVSVRTNTGEINGAPR